MGTRCFLLGFLITIAGAVPVRGQGMAGRVAALDQQLPGIMDSAGVPGLVLAAFEEGKPVALRAYGIRSTATREPVDTATVFEAMSLTKQIVAYTALKLVERGQLDLDKPAWQYVPHPDLQDDPRSKLITPRMLLSHSSGLPNWRPDGGKLTINSDPGTRFGYSGEGYVWLGMVIERIAGKPLNDVAITEVFTPLRMRRSSLVWEARFADNAAVGHTDAGPIEQRTTWGVNAAASLRTTIADYARFVSALTAPTGMSKATQKLMLTPTIRVADSLDWGLGVAIERAGGKRAFMQWGDNFGFKGFLLVDPDAGTGLVYFANSNNGMSVRREILSRLMPGPHPSTAWNQYEQYDSPIRATRRDLAQALVSGGVPAMMARYDELKRTRPAAAFDESILNTMGYELLRSKQTSDAIAVFQRNVQEYPEASNPYDSLGEAYAADGQTALAIKNYRKSFELDPSNTNAKRIADELERTQSLRRVPVTGPGS